MIRGILKLQQGRGFEAAETSAAAREAAIAAEKLQQGRGFEAAETHQLGLLRRQPLELQQGRGFEAAETGAGGVGAGAISRLQQGRGFEAAETSKRKYQDLSVTSTSTGPRV